MKKILNAKRVSGISFRLSALGVLILIITAASGCSSVRLQFSQFGEDRRSVLPQDLKAAEEDLRITDPNSFVIEIKGDTGRIFAGDKEFFALNLTKEIRDKMDGLDEKNKVVFLEIPESILYKNVSDLFHPIREAGVRDVRFVVFKNEFKPGVKPAALRVELAEKPDDGLRLDARPNPLMLSVSVDKDGKINLNAESIEKAVSLTDRLTDVFKEREDSGVFREGTNEIEKTVFINASTELSYGEVVKIIDAVKMAGGSPVKIKMEGDNPPAIIGKEN